MKLSIIMPAYNERKTIREIAARVLAAEVGPLEKELVIVDDGSTDGTRDILRELDEKGRRPLLMQPRNTGKGAGVWTGLRASTGDIAVIQDADLEYDPEEYRLLLGPILAGRPTSSTARASSETLTGTASSISGTRSGTGC